MRGFEGMPGKPGQEGIKGAKGSIGYTGQNSATLIYPTLVHERACFTSTFLFWCWLQVSQADRVKKECLGSQDLQESVVLMAGLVSVVRRIVFVLHCK